jgi:hypothetical protein
VVIWNVFPHFGILFQEKSGNPGLEWTSTWERPVLFLEFFSSFLVIKAVFVGAVKLFRACEDVAWPEDSRNTGKNFRW